MVDKPDVSVQSPNNNDIHAIEAKWRQRWQQTQIYKTDLRDESKPKYYNLMEFPYPSGEGLHVGHVYTYSGADTNGRYRRMRGYNVFEPMGFDAFGIHSENYALKLGINPMVLTQRTVSRFREQMNRLGCMWDWSHEVNTSQPNYYKWTQWLFLQMYKAGLAVRKSAPVNWCPQCLTVLANEQVINGRCERCDTEVIQREMVQWFFKITDYAERLLNDLDKLDWPEVSKRLQRNWIGRSEGAELIFTIESTGDKVPVFTTRPDTVFGATYVVLAPEHPLVDKITTPECREAVQAYKEATMREREIERLSLEKEKTGVFTGAYAINPANGERIPVWIADYVLMTYGTGAIMAVPAHDERDHEFAKKFGLPIVEVVQSPEGVEEQAYIGPGQMKNSGQFDGMPNEEAKKAITDWLAERGLGKHTVTYRLRDWLISRQRYWGPPIPIIYCDNCGEVPVPEDQLPVELPYIENFRPTGTGKSPLALVEEFYKTECPNCGGPAVRETDVSDTFLDSSWYYLRYPSTEFDDRPFDRDITRKWLPVDSYMGGKEHIVLHHLYSRFVTKVLYDLGYLEFDEPFTRLRLHGIITHLGAKMSKSRGNVVNPDEYIEKYGADALRTYLLFMGPYEDDNEFSVHGVQGVSRFLNRLYSLVDSRHDYGNGPGVDMKMLHRTIDRVTRGIEDLKYHTSIAALMEMSNWIADVRSEMTKEQLDTALKNLVLMLAPIAPHTAEELWERLGGAYSVHIQPWPEYDPSQLVEETVTIVVQVNGKVRDKLELPYNVAQEEAQRAALESEKVRAHLDGKSVKNVIWVPGKLINIVVG
ncbi:leucyl-tRNA synthetase [Thermobaculum terrenum ATCC BAA-798]|uniref:Leucine--tRNA ligase n=1 Tax=Thermobaculum terrenum (strain ATCC BAA-798 / CCMEE 7001 / YNP1) TaxID=525904 RepID=D1CG69_THET1|nr:leucine--tRNA ligase [Thermobaculum terrenum]ACZ41925.1 leucyl-tRNA synthetase [Thermobaculum terrenum ATCC BAA-798]